MADKKDAEKKSGPQQPTQKEETKAKKTILYIEDDDGSRVLARKVLEAAGYSVLTARDGLLGIDAAQRHDLDLILMDINLPHLSGEAVTTRLKGMERTKDIPIVALTAQTEKGFRERALVAGCIGFINKPIDVDTLATQVEEYLNGRRDELSSSTASRYQVEYNQSLVARLETQVRQLEAANRELVRVDKMKNDFITLTSHEMRTPLTLVQGYTHLLEDAIARMKDLDPQSELPTLVESMTRSVTRLSEIINEILNISRIATGQVEPAFGPIYLQKVVNAAVDEIRESCEQRKITLKIATDGWPPLFQADGELLKVGFRNVLGNGLKYTPDEGTISVTVETVDDTAIVSVEDTGIGIDPEDQQLVFDQFYTAGNVQLHSTSKTNFKGGGLGLGLAIARGVVEAHKGKIWVDSPGRDEEKFPGSKFSLLIPLKGVIRSEDKSGKDSIASKDATGPDDSSSKEAGKTKAKA